MKWFDGSIEDAVTAAKERRSYFVVYIEGVDRLTETMTAALNYEDISKILETGNYISVRVKFGSDEYKQFVEIYKHVPVPSLFLIGLNGIPVAVVSNSVGQDVGALHEQILEAIVLKEKFRKHDSLALMAIAEANKNINNVVLKNAVTDGMSSEMETDDVIPEPAGSSKTCDRKETSASNKESYIIRTVEASATFHETMETTAEDVCAELTNNDEPEVTSAKQFKQDDSKPSGSRNNSHSRKQSDASDDIRCQELQQEKLRNELDRKRVLNDIAMDRQERVAWQEEMKTMRFAAPSNEAENKVPLRTEHTPLTNSQTRIQFRKSNGATFTDVFDVDSVLNELRQYVVEHVGINSTQFQLATAFPRHVFTETEYGMTLTELNLVPNAVILIIPHSEGTSSTSYLYSQLSNTFWFITSPITGLYRSLVGEPHPSPAPPPSQGNENVYRRPTEETAQNQEPDNQRKPSQQNFSGNRNVYTLEDLTRDNNNRDRNDVWNGNSTQQMQ